MQSITVLFKEENETGAQQLEVSLGMKVSDLIHHLVQHFKYPQADEKGRSVSYVLRAYPPRSGTSLQECLELLPDQTLAGAGITNGSRLVLARRDSKTTDVQSQDFTTQGGVIPVSEWLQREVED